MKEIRLNGLRMTDKKTAHEYLKSEMDLPDYYGNNLDALWDCLTTDFSPRKITIINAADLLENMGAYGERLIKVFEDVVEENGCIKLEIYKNNA